jgi:cobalt-zinc-cadmium efflux system membrane fusion protein
MGLSHIDSGVRGRIVEVHVQRGTLVEVGAPLVTLTSPEFTRGQVDFLGALADMEIQQHAVERAEELVEAEVISRAELERRRSQLFVASTDVKSHRSQLKLVGMAPRDIDEVETSRAILEEVTVYSRTHGTVIERMVNREQVVVAGELVFTIADLSRVRVEGEAPADEVQFLGSADHVLVEIPALDAERIKAELLYVAATADRATRTVTVRTEIDNPGASIKPEMLAILVVVGSAETGLVVPASAIVREGSQDYVFVQEGSGRYRFAKVAVKPEVDGNRAVSRGLREGDLVVVDGASRLNSERRQRAGN